MHKSSKPAGADLVLKWFASSPGKEDGSDRNEELRLDLVENQFGKTVTKATALGDISQRLSVSVRSLLTEN